MSAPAKLSYLTAAESTVVVELPRFAYGAAPKSDHVSYHLKIIDGILEGRRTFSVACDASAFSVWHTAAVPMLVELAREARARYKNKLDAILILDAPLLLRTTYRTVIAPFIPPTTAAKVSFVSTPAIKQGQ